VLLTRRAGDHHLTVVYGQQRCTTTCLFLSSLRDFILSQAIPDAALRERAEAAVGAIDASLFPLGGHGEWVSRPTYFDFVSFDRCVRASHFRLPLRTPLSRSTRKITLCAGAVFDDVLCNGMFLGRVRRRIFEIGEVNERLEEVVSCLAQAVLDMVYVMFF